MPRSLVPPRAAPRSSGATARGRRVSRAAVAHVGAVAGLLLVAGWLRAAPLGPSSLWLDDAWVALVARADSVAETARIGATAPGFAFLLQAWLAAAGFTEARAQALPFLFGAAAPALLYVVAVARRMSAAAAVVGATLLATAPVHVEYATRVKHYTLDAVLAIGVLAVVWWALDDRTRPRRWFAVAAAAAGATAASGALAAYAAGAIAAGAVALRPGAPQGTRAARRAALAALAGYAAFAAVWWSAVLRPAVNPHLRDYWSDRYLDLGAGAAALGALGGDAVRVLEGLSAAPAPMAAALVTVGVVTLIQRRPAVVALLAIPAAAAVALAALQMAPFGGGRTDTYLYPALALLVAAAVDGLAHRRSVVHAAAAVLTLGLLAAASPPAPYPAQDARPLVAEVERRAGSRDAIVVYPATVWAYALYTARPVELVADRSQGWGFQPVIDDPRVVVLGRHRDVPGRYGPELERITADHDGVWLLATHWRDDLSAIDAHLAEAGLTEDGRWQRPGARLSRFVPTVR